MKVLWLSLILAGCAAMQPVVSQQVVPPQGYIAACIAGRIDCTGGTDSPSVVHLTPRLRAQLEAVNDDVNLHVPQISDEDNYGVSEYWAYPNSRGGDCEDLALQKQRMLTKLGWPVDVLLLTSVKSWRDRSQHEVLTVVTDQGDLILDNLTSRVLTTNDAGYDEVKRQSRYRPYVWVNLDPTQATQREEGYLPLGSIVPFIDAARKIRK